MCALNFRKLKMKIIRNRTLQTRSQNSKLTVFFANKISHEFGYFSEHFYRQNKNAHIYPASNANNGFIKYFSSSETFRYFFYDFCFGFLHPSLSPRNTCFKQQQSKLYTQHLQHNAYINIFVY